MIVTFCFVVFFFFSSRRRHTRSDRDWSSDVCSSDLSSIPAIMKKHLTEAVPAFISKGISVPPEIEVVVRHALEKEPQDRTESADEFAKELRAAMSHASAMMSRTGDAPAVDPSKTIVTPPPAQTSVPPSPAPTGVPP